MPSLAGDVADDGHLERQIGGEHPQRAMLRMVIVHRDRRHERIDGDHPGVVGHHQCTACGRDVLDAADLDPEPLLEQRPERGQEDTVGEVRVVTELVHLVVPRETPAHEARGTRHLTHQAIAQPVEQ